MIDWIKRRDSICIAIVFFYCIPLLFVGSFSFIDHQIAFGLCLLSLSIGTIILYTLMANWENHLRQQAPEPIPIAPIPDFSSYNQEIEQQKNEIETLISSHEQYRNDMNNTIEALTKENQLLIDQITHKEHLLEMNEQTSNELRSAQERKQQRITQLETKVRDLSYEIKTLLQLTEIPDAPDKSTNILKETTQPFRIDPKRPTDKQVHTQEEASAQLKRCIDIAQKMTGASHYSSSNSRFRGIPVDNFALDLRCLFDSLRSENSCSILFYSSKENKLLFANDQTSKLFGWTPEKFVQSFEHLVQEGKDEWNNAIKQLSAQSEAKIRIVLKSRTGEDILVHGLLGMIPTGIFRHHIICIFYSTDQRQAFSSSI